MRTIKFRAWDKNKEKMIYPGQTAIWSRHAKVSSGDLIDWFEDEDLMEFTGLKDKNGKEIYEGDLLKRDKRKKRISVAKFSGGMFLFSIVGEPYFDYPFDARKFEVVGNLYENPELLKK